MSNKQKRQPLPAMEQSRRFIEAAHELGCDEEGDAFERALDRILPPREPGQPAPRGPERPLPKGSRRHKA